jgi:hydroxymethylglutaryl-CoA lyase
MDSILLEDESLRDGLQFEKKIFSLADKLTLFNRLKNAGVRRIQVGSFVNPKIVPQMADTDQFVLEVVQTPGVLVTGLVLNERGLERAASCGLKHVSLSASVSDSHSRKNVRRSRDEAIDSVLHLIGVANNSGIEVRAGVQCAFGCVYEGAVDEQFAVQTLIRMSEAGASELNLADTTGMATPLHVKRLVGRTKEALPEATLSLHLHDTRGLGIANMLIGYEAGVRIFDTSAGGLGGCPFVEGAAGNVATEDAVNLFESMGILTGIELSAVCEVAELYEEMLERQLPGRMSRVLKAQNGCA